MPGMYPAGEYDLAGFAVGAVEKSKILTGQASSPATSCWAWRPAACIPTAFRWCASASSAQAALPATLDGKPFKAGHHGTDPPVREERAGRRCAPAADAAAPGGIKALAHITGGGLLENIPRVLPEGTGSASEEGQLAANRAVCLAAKTAGIDDVEMNRTFNNGIGMVVVVDAAHAEALPPRCARPVNRSHHRRHRGAATAPPWWWTDAAARHGANPGSSLVTTGAPPASRASRGVVVASYGLMAATLLLVMWRGLLPGLLCVCLGFC